jgi:hypothetical protein
VDKEAGWFGVQASNASTYAAMQNTGRTHSMPCRIGGCGLFSCIYRSMLCRGNQSFLLARARMDEGRKGAAGRISARGAGGLKE